MLDYTQDLAKIESDIKKIKVQISLCRHHDVIDGSWKPMLNDRLKKKAEIENIIELENCFI